MAQNRLVDQLHATTHGGGKCLLPYVTAGYPDLATTIALVQRFDTAGCEAIEVGFPFSDSIADGPTIQESFYRALDTSFRTSALLAAIESVRNSVSASLVAMVSMSIVRRHGVERFLRRLAGSGFDGVIVPDVPVEECDVVAKPAESCGLCNVLMSAPTSSDQRRRQIAERSSGFVYLIAAKGTTGERTALPEALVEDVRRMRSMTPLPLMVGFGISTPDQVRAVCRAADGAIVGSAIVRRIAQHVQDGHGRDELIASVGAYVDDLRTGTRLN